MKESVINHIVSKKHDSLMRAWKSNKISWEELCSEQDALDDWMDKEYNKLHSKEIKNRMHTVGGDKHRNGPEGAYDGVLDGGWNQIER
jgi:hypothetical protein